MEQKQFDVLVIGGGPGGYVAAIRAAQLGLNTACCEYQSYADKDKKVRFGGTCLNVGCIPSKSLLHTSHLFEQANDSFAQRGIKLGHVNIDVAKMQQQKEGVVTQLTGGIQFLFKKNKVEALSGKATFNGKKENYWSVTVDKEEILAKNVIIATGSVPRQLPILPIDNKIICDNVGALDFESVPKELVVIGAGVIGLELGSVWRRLGSKVTVLEALPEFMMMADKDVAKEALKIFSRQGMNFEFGVNLQSSKFSNKNVSIEYIDKAGEAKKITADNVIVSVGRIPYTQGLNAEAIGLPINERGQIEVDEHCQTKLSGIWAIGDVVRGPMLAHKAMEEGVMVAERIVGQAGHCDLNLVPSVVYTSPEIAWVGKTEQQLKDEGRKFKVGKAPFAANGRALGMGESQGFVKIIADEKTDQILGVHIIGSNASEIIAEAVVAMEFKAAAEDLARICHAHPTLSEMVHEAALGVDKRSLHC